MNDFIFTTAIGGEIGTGREYSLDLDNKKNQGKILIFKVYFNRNGVV